MELLLVALVAAIVVAVALLALRPRTPSDLSVPLQHLNASVASVAQQNAALLSSLDALQQRVTSLESTGAAVRDHVVDIRTRTEAREDRDRQSAETLRRLEQVIAGTASKGAAGENIVDLVFGRLPSEWQVRGLTVNNRPVEFALKLPNGLHLPIDSKWPATNLIEQLIASTDLDEQRRLRADVERAVRDKAREVTKYIEPGRTTTFAIAVVPDAVLDLTPAAQADAARDNVAIVGYSTFIPYLLLVFHTVLTTAGDVDAERLATYLATFEQCLQGLQDEVDGRLSRAIVMLENSRDSLRANSSRMSGHLAALNAESRPLQLE